ncbi:MAG: 50S ribosomal protein L9 [Clostridia bacterium]|nr:50S ribosomal protein L9 [Clostridia bacterium]
MIVILTKDVKGTGKAGDVVKVNDGYARNMLIPKGLAKEATQGNVRNLEKQKAIAEEKRAEEKAAAQKKADELEKITLIVKSKGGENGKLFGSVTSMDIAKALKEQEGIDVDKKKIEMAGPIKQAGETQVTVKLFPEVAANIKVKVTV